MAFGWEGEKVRLVPLDKQKHLENLLAWLNDPEVTTWTRVGDWPILRHTEEERFDRTDAARNDQFMFAIETLAGEHLGITGIHDIDWRDKTARTNILLGAKHRWGQGFGLDAVRIRTQYAFDVLGLRMLLTEVMADNAASLSILHKVGYIDIGRIPRRYWKRGAYRDVVLLLAGNEPWARSVTNITTT